MNAHTELPSPAPPTTGAPSDIRVVVVDIHPVVRLGMVQAILADPACEVVAEYDRGQGLADLLDEARADVVTLGRQLADGDGLALARELRARRPGLGIVVVSAFDDDDTLLEALAAGASAFVSKRAGVAEIVAAIRHAAVAASSFAAGGLAAALARRSAPSPVQVLSPRERDVLELLLAGHSVPEVAQRLFISVSTAKTYVARLYDKLDASNRAQALMHAVERGLIARPVTALATHS